MVGIHLDKPFPLYPQRLSARGHARIRAPHRPLVARQQGGLRHRDHRGARRGAHAHRLADRLHLGRQRVPGRRARRGDPALGAVQDLRDRARNSARSVRGGPRDRAPVHRHARRSSRARRTATITPCRRPRACCSTNSTIAASSSTASARSSTCSSGAASAIRRKPRTMPTAWRRPSRRWTKLDAGLIFVNLVDFDQQYGHRNDVEGYGARARSSSTPGCPSSRTRSRPGDLVIFTADHGCDPCIPGTDHSREYVPLLACGPQREAGVDLGVRAYALRYRPDRGREFRREPRARRQLFTANLMRKPVMAGNWKMYKTPAETTAFFEKFRPLVEKSEHCEVVICPPFTNLAAAVAAVQGSHDPHRRAEHRLGQGRRVHRRDLRPDDRRHRRDARASSAIASGASTSARPTRRS